MQRFARNQKALEHGGGDRFGFAQAGQGFGGDGLVFGGFGLGEAQTGQSVDVGCRLLFRVDDVVFGFAPGAQGQNGFRLSDFGGKGLVPLRLAGLAL